MPDWYEPGIAIECLDVFLPSLPAALTLAPEASAVARRYVHAPPSEFSRQPFPLYDRLPENEQDAILNVILDSLIRWRVFRSLEELRPFLDPLALADGEDAFERLLGFHCLLKEAGPEDTLQFLDTYQSKWLSLRS